MHKKDGKEVYQNVFKVRFSLSDRKMGDIFSLHFPIISELFFFCTLLCQMKTHVIFLKALKVKA